MTASPSAGAPTIPRRSLMGRGSEAVIVAGLSVAKLAVVAMLIIITSEIVARSVFGLSLMVAEEFAGYLLLVMTFSGAAFCLRDGALLRVTFFLFAMPARMRMLADSVLNTLSLLLILTVVAYQAIFNWSTWTRGMVAPTLSEIPLWIPQVAMPVGSLILAIALVLELRDSFSGLPRGTPPVQPADQQRSEVN